jgi:hypothetical protein
MSNFGSLAETLVRETLNNPAQLMPILAYACVITMLIAIVSDTIFRKKELAPQRKPVENLRKSKPAGNGPDSPADQS